MSHINWTTDVFIDPVTFTAGPGPDGIPIPTYGNYGGPDYSDGEVGGAVPVIPGTNMPDFSTAVDPLDKLFEAHDFAYQSQPSANEIPVADLALIQGIEHVTALRQLDAEASLYGGAAILGVMAFMAANGHPLSPIQSLFATATAAYDIQYGLNHLSPTERALAEGALQNIVAAFDPSPGGTGQALVQETAPPDETLAQLIQATAAMPGHTHFGNNGGAIELAGVFDASIANHVLTLTTPAS
jgi:hypothetical protein